MKWKLQFQPSNFFPEEASGGFFTAFVLVTATSNTPKCCIQESSTQNLSNALFSVADEFVFLQLLWDLNVY